VRSVKYISLKSFIAVHSLKDVPSYIPDGLELVAVTKREDQSDVFLSHKFRSLEELPKNSVIGTTAQTKNADFNKKSRFES